MRHQTNEWISISDLMAGVVAVIMLLLISVIVKAKDAEAKAKEAAKPTPIKSASQLEGKEIVKTILVTYEEGLNNGSENVAIKVDPEQGVIILSESVFEIKSACPKGIFKNSNKIAVAIADFFKKLPTGTIAIEGHTDTRPVKNIVTNVKDYCAVFDDNFTLSAARAREIRKVLISEIPVVFHKSIFIAGYGDLKLLPGKEGSEAENRRVEIRFVTNYSKNEYAPK